MAFNVVFMSLFAMLPSPMVYGAIIDNTCILWQEECGETTNCLLYSTEDLRKALMLTTACIMLIGVIFDIGAWYYSKDLLIFNPEQKLNREEAMEKSQQKDDDDGDAGDTLTKAVSALSLNKGSVYKNGGILSGGQ